MVDPLANDFGKCVVNKAQAILEKEVSKCNILPAYWIVSNNPRSIDSISGSYFCKKCALKKIEELKQNHPSDRFHCNGNYCIFENDCPASCDTCSNQLEYSLSDVSGEVNHFFITEFNLNNPYTCYELERVLHWYNSSPEGTTKERIVKVAAKICELGET